MQLRCGNILPRHSDISTVTVACNQVQNLMGQVIPISSNPNPILPNVIAGGLYVPVNTRVNHFIIKFRHTL